jgi:hypothetical protein
MNLVDATSILPNTGQLLLPTMPRGDQQNDHPLSIHPMSGQSALRRNDVLHLQNMLYRQDQHRQDQENQQQELHGLTLRLSTVGSTQRRDALHQDGQVSASTLYNPLPTGPSPSHTSTTAHAPTILCTLTAPSTDQEGSGPFIVSVHLPCTLSNPIDVGVLSNHQIYLLCQQIESVATTMADLVSHVRGRNSSILVDQVGIRCRHCGHVPMHKRQAGST